MGFRRVISQYHIILNKYPLCTQAVQTGILMGVGDFISQKWIEGKSLEKIEWKRTARFFGLGVIFMGPVLQTWYRFLDRKFHRGTLKITLKKVALDQLLFSPCIITSLMFINGTLQNITWQENVNKWKSDFKDILIGNYMLWPGVQIANFYIVPLNYQVTVVQTVALIWNSYLSWKFHSVEKPSK